jgi:Tfp pilus assembly major pilin PilA
MRQPLQTERGGAVPAFSLVELLVAVLIVVVLAAIATPIYLKQKEKAEDAAVPETMRSLGIFAAVGLYDGSLQGGDGSSVGDLTTSRGSMPKSGIVVFADVATKQLCLSKTTSNGQIYAATVSSQQVYPATESCTSASSQPPRAAG